MAQDPQSQNPQQGSNSQPQSVPQPPPTQPNRRRKLRIRTLLAILTALGVGGIITAATTGVFQIANTVVASFLNRTPVSTSVVQTPTIQLTLTSTPTQSPLETYNKVSGMDADITDPLNGQSGLNWTVYTRTTETGAVISCSFEKDGYHAIAIPGKGDAFPVTTCFAQSYPTKLGNNYVLQTDITPLKGTGGGVIYNSEYADSNSTMYRVRIGNRDSTFDFYRQGKNPAESKRLGTCPHPEDPNSASPLYNSNEDASIDLAINKNQQNTIVLVVRGGVTTLIVKGKEIYTVCDRYSSSGLIGFFSAAYKEPTEVVFSNLKIWKL